MLNQNLVNLSPVDVELCEIRNDSVESAKSEILPSMFNFVIVELNNLEELINDSAYLQRNFKFEGFSKTIEYDSTNGFRTRQGLIRIAKINPKDLIGVKFTCFGISNGHRQFCIENQFNEFCNYIEDFKANYLAYMKDVQASQRRILEKIGCE